jgi:hypothetical protein
MTSVGGYSIEEHSVDARDGLNDWTKGPWVTRRRKKTYKTLTCGSMQGRLARYEQSGDGMY